MKFARIAILAAGVSLSGCANEFVTNDHIADETSGMLGTPVTISERQYTGGVNTYYTATTRNGRRYRCTINGSALSLGWTNPPTCNP